MEPKPTFTWIKREDASVFHLTCVDHSMYPDPDIAIYGRKKDGKTTWFLVDQYWSDYSRCIAQGRGNEKFWEFIELGKAHWLYEYANR